MSWPVILSGVVRVTMLALGFRAVSERTESIGGFPNRLSSD